MNRVKFAKLAGVLIALALLVSACRPPEVEGTVINIKNQQYDNALESAEEAVKKYPDNAEAWYYYGWLNGEHKQNWSKMNEGFDKAMALNPATKVSVQGMNVSLSDAVKQYRTNTFAEKFNSAGRDLKKASETDDPEAQRQLYMTAQEKLEVASKVAPDRHEPYRPLALTYLQLGDTTKAGEVLETGIQKFGDNEELLIVAGEVYTRSGDFDRAAELFVKASEVNPENGDVYQKLGNLEASRGNWTKANEYYGKAIEMDPTNSNLAFNIGVSFYNQGQFEKAIPFFVTAVENDAENMSNYEILGQTYVRAEKYSEAVPFLENATSKYPDNADMWELLAIAYGRTDQAAKSNEAFKKSQDLRGTGE